MGDRTGGDALMHTPLPYVVRLRISESDDTEPRIVEVRQPAYSAMEACMQACLQASGTAALGEASNVKIESVQPDEKAYLADLRRRRAEELRGLAVKGTFPSLGKFVRDLDKNKG